MQITIRLHGEASRYLANGRDTAALDVPDGATVASVLDGLGMPRQEYWLLAVNGHVARPDSPLRPGDLVECVAPMSGG